MILDITFTDKGPLQYQRVRMHTVYMNPTTDLEHGPEVIIHFAEFCRNSVAIPLAKIKTIQVTND